MRFVVCAGKSAFASYLLQYLMTKPEACPKSSVHARPNRIMFQYRKLGIAYLFERADDTALWSASEILFANVSKNLSAKTVYIVDGDQPASCGQCPTVLITSPRWSIYKDFCKSDLVRCVSEY